MQTRKHSVIETAANVLVGYLAAVCSQMMIFPLFGISVPVRTNFIMGAWFTGASVVRAYSLRRMFARWEGGS